MANKKGENSIVGDSLLRVLGEDGAWAVSDAAIERLTEVIDRDEPVDLHCHTRHSDGEWTPEGLVEDAHQLSLGLISLTDHDTIGGQRAAANAAGDAGIHFLPGMEVSMTVDGRLYHVLCYDFSPASPTWELFAEMRRKRFDLMYLEMFDQLTQRGYSIDPDVARDESGHFVDGPLSVALHRSGQAASVDAANQTLRGLGLRRHHELLYQDAFDVGQILTEGEAIFSVAHPARNESGVSARLSEEDLKRLIDALPLVALEAHHPYHRPEDVEHFRNLAHQYGLAVTCGSDAHGARYRRPLRQHPSSMCGDFLRLVRDRWASRVPSFAVR